MGVSGPSLFIESTDSTIYSYNSIVCILFGPAISAYFLIAHSSKDKTGCEQDLNNGVSAVGPNFFDATPTFMTTPTDQCKLLTTGHESTLIACAKAIKKR